MTDMESSQTENSQQDNPIEVVRTTAVHSDAETEGLTHQLHIGRLKQADDLSVYCGVPPIQRLSYELLSEIFSYVHYDRVSPHPEPTRQLVLSQVCSTWRQIVHRMPRLWTQFSVRILHKVGNATRQRSVDHVSFAKAWLLRAHPHPTDVTLHDYNKTITFANILDAVVPNADRLQSLSLHLPFPNFRPLVDIPAHSMPCLECIHLSATSEGDVEEPSWAAQIVAFLTAPRLYDISLSSTSSMSLLDSNLPMPWTQLTSLDISERLLPADKCRNIFFQCINLVNCHLTVKLSMEPMAYVPSVVHPHLQELSVKFHGLGDPFLFFQPLRLPALLDLLVITSDVPMDYWTHEVFMEFTLSSPLHLKTVSFLQVEISSDEMLLFLAHMPSLVELYIDRSPCLTNQFFDTLRWHETGHGTDHVNVVPKLRMLQVRPGKSYDIDKDIIADMICSRWWRTEDDASPLHAAAVSRLQFAIVLFIDDIDDYDEYVSDADEELGMLLLREKSERLRSEGLEVWVGSSECDIPARVWHSYEKMSGENILTPVACYGNE